MVLLLLFLSTFWVLQLPHILLKFLDQSTVASPGHCANSRFKRRSSIQRAPQSTGCAQTPPSPSRGSCYWWNNTVRVSNHPQETALLATRQDQALRENQQNAGYRISRCYIWTEKHLIDTPYPLLDFEKLQGSSATSTWESPARQHMVPQGR